MSTAEKTNNINVKDNQNGRKNMIINWRENEIVLLLENFYFSRFLVPFHVVRTLRKVLRSRFAPLFWAERNCSDLCCGYHHCRFSYAGNWELVKSKVGTKFRRSHVFLHSQVGNGLWQLMALLFFIMLWLFLYKNWHRW